MIQILLYNVEVTINIFLEENMKKFAVLALLLSSMLTLTACGSKTEAPAETPVATEAPAASETPATEEAFTGEKVGEVADEEGKTVATVTFEAGTPVSVKFDYISTKDNSSKYEAAAAGTYDMGEGSTPWNEQVDSLATFLAENNFDLEKVTLTDEDGHTDAVTGVSIKVPALLEAVKAALN